MKTLSLFAITALAEIGGCFAAYAVLRQEKSPVWLLPGAAALLYSHGFSPFTLSKGAGRIYAAYGGVYIVASLFWLWCVEGMVPDRWDIAGASLCLFGAGIIMLAPRV